MFNIADYFKKFAKIEGETMAKKDGLARAFKSVYNLENVKYENKKGVLYIKGSPAMRMAIFTKKARLLETIRKESPLSEIYDIR